MTQKFKPFENETQIVITDTNYNELNIVNEKNSISIFGTLETPNTSNEIQSLLTYLTSIKSTLVKSKYKDNASFLKNNEKITLSKKKNNIKIDVDFKIEKSNTGINILQNFMDKIMHYQKNS